MSASRVWDPAPKRTISHTGRASLTSMEFRRLRSRCGQDGMYKPFGKVMFVTQICQDLVDGCQDLVYGMVPMLLIRVYGNLIPPLACPLLTQAPVPLSLPLCMCPLLQVEYRNLNISTEALVGSAAVPTVGSSFVNLARVSPGSAGRKGPNL